MPTYENTTSQTLQIKSPDGTAISVEAGDTITTNFYTNSTGFSKTSDEPYVNDVVSRTTVTLSETATTVAVGLNIKEVAVFKISDSVNVFLQTTSNTPAALAEWTSEDPVILLEAHGRFTQLQLTGTGTCEVVQYR